MGPCGYKLLPRAVRAGIPGVPDDGLCGNLCSPHRQHPGIFGYSLGVVRHDGLHGDSLLLAAQNGKSVQTDLRQSLNPGKSNERKRQQTTPFPGGGLAVLVINGLCNDSQRPFQSEKQGLSEPDETPARVYGFRGRNWCSVLLSHARYAWNEQCSGRHSFNEKVETIRKAKAEMKRQRDCLNNLDVEHLPWIEDFKSYQNLTSLNRRVLVELVESITVYDKEHIHIQYRFDQEIRNVLEYCSSVPAAETEESAV